MNQKASKKACINPNYSLTSERMGKTEVNKSDCYTSSWQSVLGKDKKGKGGAQRTQDQDESHWVLIPDFLFTGKWSLQIHKTRIIIAHISQTHGENKMDIRIWHTRDNESKFLNVTMEKAQDNNIMGVFWGNLEKFWEEISQKKRTQVRTLGWRIKWSGLVLEVPRPQFG